MKNASGGGTLHSSFCILKNFIGPSSLPDEGHAHGVIHRTSWRDIPSRLVYASAAKVRRQPMRKAVCLALALGLLAGVAAAQMGQANSNSSNPVSDSVRGMVAQKAKNFTAAAEEMPADKYTYKPTAQQMSFGKLVTHMIQSNNFLCSKLTSQAASAQKASETDPKDKLVSELKNSFDYCETALKGVQDSQLSEPVTLWGGWKANKATALIALSNDWADHYSQAAMYLRLNGMLPPTAKKTETAAKE
jgi:uncharacterized damage-inducible protein DinB